MITKNDLIAWLKEIDKKLNTDIVLIAVGGTAMTLLGLKSSTIDIDFCLSSKDEKEFESVLDKKFRVDLFFDGFIFSEQLPDDYQEISKDILELKNIKLKALNPIDIVITKCARLNARDEEDISAIAKYVDKQKLLERFELVVKTYAGNEKIYRENFEYVFKRYLEKK